MSQLLTVAEAADELRVSTRTIRRRIAAGDLSAWRLGVESRAPLRVPRHALEAFLRPATTKESHRA